MLDVSSITWGIVRGRKIHLDCATVEEAGLTWAGFYRGDTAEPCEECGQPLGERQISSA